MPIAHSVIVYRIVGDENFQILHPKKPYNDIRDRTLFNCQSRIDEWEGKPEYSILDETNKQPNFFTLISGGKFIIDKKVWESPLIDIIRESGELLPISVNGEILHLLNVIRCVDFLWYSNYPSQFTFDIDKLSKFPLFKTEQSRSVELFCLSDPEHPEEDFRELYRASGLKGLRFEKLVNL